MLLLTWKTTFRFRQSLQIFSVIATNNCPRISGTMGFTTEEKAFYVTFESTNKTTVHSKYRAFI
jgi:hypothetical protein